MIFFTLSAIGNSHFLIFYFFSLLSAKESSQRPLWHTARTRRATSKWCGSRPWRVVRRRPVLQRTRSDSTRAKAPRRSDQRKGIRHTVHKCPIIFNKTAIEESRWLVAWRYVEKGFYGKNMSEPKWNTLSLW